MAITRVGIVNDHPAVLLGAAGILNSQPDIRVAVVTATVTELLNRRAELDVILLDLVLADGSTPTANLIRLRATGVPVLAFTSGDRPALVREAARTGAVGMLRKSERPESIIGAVRSVLRGEVVATSDWAAALDDDAPFVTAHLSRREAEVLALYAAGETADRVGEQLFISRDTVIDHIRRIRAKYAAADRPAHTKVDLYQRAVEDGILTRTSSP